MESYSKTGDKARLLRSVFMPKNLFRKAEMKIKRLSFLDEQYVEPLVDAFLLKSQVFVVSKFIGQGYRDLYHLAAMRQVFTEQEVGRIAV